MESTLYLESPNSREPPTTLKSGALSRGAGAASPGYGTVSWPPFRFRVRAHEFRSVTLTRWSGYLWGGRPGPRPGLPPGRLGPVPPGFGSRGGVGGGLGGAVKVGPSRSESRRWRAMRAWASTTCGASLTCEFELPRSLSRNLEIQTCRNARPGSAASRNPHW